MIGREEKVRTNDGKLRVKVTESPVYLQDVGPELEKMATKELRADRWPKPPKPPRNSRTAHEVKIRPKLDGTMETWNGMTKIALINPKVAGDDASGMASVGWDDEFLYVAVEMRDNELLNVQPRAKLFRQDSIELLFSTEPRDAGSGYGPNDFQLFLVPTSGEGRPLITEVTDRESGKVEDIGGALCFAGKVKNGWILQTAIPWKQFKGFAPKLGSTASFELRVNDADTSHERFKIDPSDIPDSSLDTTNPAAWSLLRFEK
jgi:hypothetical protein